MTTLARRPSLWNPGPLEAPKPLTLPDPKRGQEFDAEGRLWVVHSVAMMADSLVGVTTDTGPHRSARFQVLKVDGRTILGRALAL